MRQLQAPAITDTAERHSFPAPAGGRYVASRTRLAACDGVSLHYRSWLPTDRPVAGALVFLHGIASHGAWFAETAGFLAGNGIAVYAPDRRGSGLSGGLRGHTPSVSQLLHDLDRVVCLVEIRHPETPLFLVGSSWAAKLALAYAAGQQSRLAGLLLHGPGLFPKVDLSPFRKLRVLLGRLTRPERQIQIPLIPENYTDDEEYRAYIRQDAYRLLTASARFFWETRRLDRARDQYAARLSLPILLQIGERDPIMDAAASCRWLGGLLAPDRTAITYPDASHTLDFEPEPTLRAYRADLLGWLRRQIAQHAAGEAASEGRHGR
ncbi:MAG: alpha/beta fold hydrolase [Chloroflexi bacterium]|nr:alpha/beta fold hydrolase [Chloroflexota bacterium]